MARNLSKTRRKEIARGRIEILFREAEKAFSGDKGLANRYVTLARKIAMKVRLRLPKEYRRKFCRHCYRYLRPGVNARVRTRAGKVVISCLECRKFMRIPVR